LLYSNATSFDAELEYAACFPGDPAVLMRKMISDARAPRALLPDMDNFDCALLTQQSWPPVASNERLQTGDLPIELQRMATQFEKQFFSETPPRKLQWAHHMSRLTMNYTSAKGTQYEVNAGISQALVLLALSEANAAMSFDELCRQAKLSRREVYRQVKPLISIHLVSWNKDIRSYSNLSDDTQIFLNPAFENKKTKIRFAPVSWEMEIDEGKVEEVPMASSVPDPSKDLLSEADKYVLQCLIVRIAKKHKTVSAAHMLQQVTGSWDRACHLSPTDISDALNMLQDKEFLEYDSSHALYRYLP
jgi:hypothetical protein